MSTLSLFTPACGVVAVIIVWSTCITICIFKMLFIETAETGNDGEKNKAVGGYMVSSHISCNAKSESSLVFCHKSQVFQGQICLIPVRVQRKSQKMYYFSVISLSSKSYLTKRMCSVESQALVFFC